MVREDGLVGSAFLVPGGQICSRSRSSYARSCNRKLRKGFSPGIVSMNAQEEDGKPPLEINLRWRDRVAVFAQICPEKTLDSILEALRENVKNGPRKDDGLEALYTFANFSVWQANRNFFGRSVDIGQFESFRRVMITKPYEIIVNHARREVLSAIRATPNSYHSRINFVGDSSSSLTFHITMTRTTLGNFETWMVDSVIPETDNSE